MLQLKNSSFEDFAVEVKNTGRKIVVYGAGVIGQVALPYLLHVYELEEMTACYVDADICKQGRNIPLMDRQVPVISLEEAVRTYSDFILLITNSRLEPVLSYLDDISELSGKISYILPVMLLTYREEEKKRENLRRSEIPLIPKIIHYCWFSGKPLPDYLNKCIETWKKFCPDYEIVRWDESNYDVSGNLYMRQAYEKKKWGFIPDVARLDILYRYGGIYLDTDVELIRNLDELLYQPAFCGTEQWGIVNFGSCSGASAGNELVGELLEFRRGLPFLYPDGAMNSTTCGYYETIPLVLRGFQVNRKTQTIGNMTIYAPEYFCPAEYMSGELHITGNTFSIHHFDGSWLDEKNREKREKASLYYQDLLKRIKKQMAENG